MTDSPLFKDLHEESLESSIGDLTFNENTRNYTFPFIHGGIAYFAYFSTVEDSSEGLTSSSLQDALNQDCPGILIGKNPFFMKFGLAEETDSKLMFAKKQTKIKSGMFVQLPQKFKLMIKELSEKVELDNLFFLAGSDDDKHHNRLILWYKRITDRIVSSDIGFEILYFNHEAGIYGYKRIN